MQNTRISHFIRRKPASNLHHATKYAAKIGCPLNTFVTINFAELGIDEKDVSSQFQKMVGQRFAPWLRRTAANNNGIRPTYVWSLEAASKRPAVHWMLHLPKSLISIFNKKLDRWVSQISSGDVSPQAIKTEKVNNDVGLKRYLLKGTDPQYAVCIGIRPTDQGIVIGKRSGFSRNLGPVARKAGGYKSKPFRIYPRTGDSSQ
jgi:hypothetical protein